MRKLRKHTLDNGLKLIVEPDHSTPLAAFNLLYKVGSRDENPEMTGFAHLFEHLMFGGTEEVPVYDMPVQLSGGENNAFTNNDFTNYYLSLPGSNIETAFWLESDRMTSLALNQRSLDVQKQVVSEEFRQRYLNHPYGDVWLHLKPLAYRKHPYQWPTIGKTIEHIEKASLEDVKAFYDAHYAPNNAILTITGDIDPEEMLEMAEKWFSGKASKNIRLNTRPEEPLQKEERNLALDKDVPFKAIYMAFHMQAKNTPGYYVSDLSSDILANGNSSRLYRKLVMEQKLFSDVNAYITGDIDPGLFVLTGKIYNEVSLEEAQNALWKELQVLSEEKVPEKELQKVINKVEANLVYGRSSILNKAMNLSLFEMIGDAEEYYNETHNYKKVSPELILDNARILFTRENCSTLKYVPKK